MWSQRTIVTLSSVLLTSVACGGGGGGSSPVGPPPAPNVVTVSMRNMRFEPQQIQIEPGTTVRWVRRGGTPDHTTTAKNGKWDSGFTFPNPGDVFEITFSQADAGQTFEYLCQTHENDGMKGSVRVGEDAPRPSPGY